MSDKPTDSYLKLFTDSIGLTETGPQVFTEDKNPENADDAATVFSYSLYYVYYD